jgi:hypothetical protein
MCTTCKLACSSSAPQHLLLLSQSNKIWLANHPDDKIWNYLPQKQHPLNGQHNNLPFTYHMLMPSTYLHPLQQSSPMINIMQQVTYLCQPKWYFPPLSRVGLYSIVHLSFTLLLDCMVQGLFITKSEAWAFSLGELLAEANHARQTHHLWYYWSDLLVGQTKKANTSLWQNLNIYGVCHRTSNIYRVRLSHQITSRLSFIRNIFPHKNYELTIINILISIISSSNNQLVPLS